MARPSSSLLVLMALALAGLAVLPPLHGAGARLRAETDALTALPGTIERRNTNAFARVLGELRMGAADFLFVKTELYLHGGISYAAHTDDLDGPAQDLAAEAESLTDEPHATNGPGAAENPERDPDERHDHAHDDAHDHDQDHRQDHADEQGHDHGPTHQHAEAVPTTMRGAGDDFRGIVGHLERAIKPWRSPDSPHVLLGGAEILPWFRLMTVANPHFIRGYRIAAMWLGREKRYDAAVDFLDEGIRNNRENPEVFQLHLSRIIALLHKGRAEEGAYLEECLADAREGVRLGLAVRPEGGEVGRIHAGLLWTEDHAEDLLFLMRFEAMLLERLGRDDEALQALDLSLRLYPDDDPLLRLRQRLLEG